MPAIEFRPPHTRPEMSLAGARWRVTVAEVIRRVTLTNAMLSRHFRCLDGERQSGWYGLDWVTLGPAAPFSSTSEGPSMAAKRSGKSAKAKKRSAPKLRRKPQKSGTISLNLKIGASLTPGVNTARMYREFLQLAEDADRVRTGLGRSWQRWREDNPGYVPAQRTNRGKPSFHKKNDGTLAPSMEDPAYSQECEKLLYQRGKEIAPHLATHAITACRNEITSWLRGKSAERRGKRKWQDITDSVINLPKCSSRKIPVHATGDGDVAMYYAGKRVGHVSGDADAVLEKGLGSGKDLMSAGAVVRLFTERACVDKVSDVVYRAFRLIVGDLPPGKKEIVRKIASGEMKFRDCSIRKDDNGHWYLCLAVDQEIVGVNLNSERTAYLIPAPPSSPYPFYVATESVPVLWGVGRGRSYVDDILQSDARRKAIKRRYRTGEGMSSLRGHGRRHFWSRAGKGERANRNAQGYFAYTLIRDLIRFLQENDCGRLVYRDPSDFIRQKSWFASRKVSFNWSRFFSPGRFDDPHTGMLAFKLRGVNVDLDHEVIGISEWREYFRDKKGHGGCLIGEPQS